MFVIFYKCSKLDFLFSMSRLGFVFLFNVVELVEQPLFDEAVEVVEVAEPGPQDLPDTGGEAVLLHGVLVDHALLSH